MKIIHVFWVFVLVSIGWLGCSDDEELLTPSGIQYGWGFPQGDHDYDAKIIDFYKRTGVYMLYKFNPGDVYFSGDGGYLKLYVDTAVFTQYYNLGEYVYVKDDMAYIYGLSYPLGITYKPDGLWEKWSLEDGRLMRQVQVFECEGSCGVQVPNEEYVGQQVALLEECFLNFYSDSLLRVRLPLKIILGSDLRDYQNIKVSYHDAYNRLIFSYGDETIENLTLSEKNIIKVDLNFWFMTDSGFADDYICDYAYEDFFLLTDYPLHAPAPSQCYRLGLICRKGFQAGSDLRYYLKMIIGNSYAKLTSEPASGAYNETDYTGILHPKKDVNGLILRKYTFLVNKFKELGIDLQAMGNLYH